MSTSWYSRTDSGLLAFSQNCSARATSSPSSYGWVSSDATTLSDLVDTYATNLTAATDPGTRTKVTIAAKDVAKNALIADLKALKLKLEAAQPPIGPDPRADLGLPPTNTKPSPVPPPSTHPVIGITGAVTRTVSASIKDETTPNKKAKPKGANGAEVYSFVGITPPADISGWNFEGLCTKNEFTLSFDNSTVAGTPVWITARWYNHKGETGPFCVAPAQSVIVAVANAITAQAA